MILAILLNVTTFFQNPPTIAHIQSSFNLSPADIIPSHVQSQAATSDTNSSSVSSGPSASPATTTAIPKIHNPATALVGQPPRMYPPQTLPLRPQGPNATATTHPPRMYSPQVSTQSAMLSGQPPRMYPPQKVPHQAAQASRMYPSHTVPVNPQDTSSAAQSLRAQHQKVPAASSTPLTVPSQNNLSTEGSSNKTEIDSKSRSTSFERIMLRLSTAYPYLARLVLYCGVW